MSLNSTEKEHLIQPNCNRLTIQRRPRYKSRQLFSPIHCGAFFERNRGATKGSHGRNQIAVCTFPGGKTKQTNRSRMFWAKLKQCVIGCRYNLHVMKDMMKTDMPHSDFGMNLTHDATGPERMNVGVLRPKDCAMITAALDRCRLSS